MHLVAVRLGQYEVLGAQPDQGFDDRTTDGVTAGHQDPCLSQGPLVVGVDQAAVAGGQRRVEDLMRVRTGFSGRDVDFLRNRGTHRYSPPFHNPVVAPYR